MKVDVKEIRRNLAGRGLRVTPQRVSVLKSIVELGNHPTVDQIIDSVREAHPNIATGTVYKVLDTLVKNDLIDRLFTEQGIMRYDGNVEKHYHMYCTDCDVIKDYFDEELQSILQDYFDKKEFSGLKVEDIALQIKVKFNDCTQDNLDVKN